MKAKLILFLIFFFNIISAQESNDRTFFLDSLWKETTAEKQVYFRIIKEYYLDKSEYKFEDYYKSGKLQMQGTYKDKEGKIRTGEFIYYYENGNKKKLQNFSENNIDGKIIYWYENGNKKEEGEYLDRDKTRITSSYKIINFWNSKGEQTVVNGNGSYDSADDDSFTEKGLVKDGFREGIWLGSSKTGKYSYSESYKDGVFIKGELTDEKGKKNEYLVFEKKPEPKKGIKDFYAFIGKEFDTPREAYAKKIRGQILLTFVVEKDGDIKEIKILKGLGYGLDEEAIRVLKKYPKWIPGEQRGRKVRCLYSIPITLDYSK